MMESLELATRRPPETAPRPSVEFAGSTSVPDLAAILDPSGSLANVRPRPSASRATRELSTVLAFGDYEIAAELRGSRPPANAAVTSAPFAWSRSAAEGPTNAIAPVCVGADGSGWLFVDLALAPGVVTVTGRPYARHGFGAELANRLGAAVAGGARRLAVVVAGEPFHPDLLLVDPIRVPSIAGFGPGVLPPRAQICFLFCALSSTDDSAVIEAFARDSQLRIVPIVVDDVLGAGWSFHARTTHA